MSRFTLLDRLRGSVLAGSVGTSASEDKLLSSRESHPGVIPDYPGISRIKTWVMPSRPSPDTVLALLEFKRTYNEQWMLEKYDYRSPAQVRHDLAGLDAAA